MKIKALYWCFFNKEKYRIYKILCWIRDAKKQYTKKRSRIRCGLCSSLLETVSRYFSLNIYGPERGIQLIIPEYTPEFFNVERSKVDGYWWPLDDVQSRINALDKLIQVYKDKLKN